MFEQKQKAAIFDQAGAKVGSIMFRSAVAALGFAAILASGSAAQASKIHYTAEMSGRGEAPPNATAGRGHLDATLDTDTNTLTWTVTHSGMTATPIGAHFHGPVAYSGMTSEENAPIQVGTAGKLSSPFHGTTVIDATQAKDLRGGRWYFNVHTPQFPAGEIRGPVVQR
jgi:hypothetical protein